MVDDASPGTRSPANVGADYARISRNAPTMAVTAGLIVGATALWSPVFSLILRDPEASDLQISAAISVWAAIGALAQYGAGRLADKVGRFPIMVYSMHVGGLALVAAAFMPTWRPFAVVYTFWILANAVTGPVFSLIVGESIPPTKRGRAFGITESSIGASLILGPLAGAELLAHVGAKGLLIISGIFVFAAATGRLLSLRETRPESTGSKHFALRHVFEGRMGLVLLAVTLWNVVLAMTLWGPFLSLHASDAMGLSKATINVFFALASVTSVLMGLVAGRLVSRFGANKMLSVGGLGLAAAVILWSVQRSPVGIVAGFVLMSGFMMLAMVSADTFRVTVIEESVRGSALGAIGMVTEFATALATPVAGYLKQFSPMAPFWMSGLSPNSYRNPESQPESWVNGVRAHAGPSPTLGGESGRLLIHPRHGSSDLQSHRGALGRPCRRVQDGAPRLPAWHHVRKAAGRRDQAEPGLLVVSGV